MTTLDEKSPAEIAELHTAIDPDADVLECNNCGRNCRHLPSLGSGTAGGIKGTKYEPTLRSQVRCPSCGQKPHRKEGRAHQMLMCLFAQAGNHLGMTVMPLPTPEVVQAALDIMNNGAYKPAPTERQMSIIVRRAAGEVIPDEEYENTGRKTRTTSVPLRVAPGDAPTGNFEAADPIAVPNFIIEAAGNAMKRLRTDEEKAADKAKRDEERAKKKADAEAARLAKVAERERAKKEKADEKIAAAEAKLAEAKAAAERTANTSATPRVTQNASTSTAAPKKETKKEREARLLAVAEREAAQVTPTISTEPDAGTDPDADGYDPLAGVGQAFDDDDDEEETDEQLTPAQIAALGKLS